MKIVYWSGTGNTEAMAEGIAKGIKESGKEAELVNVSNVNIEELLKEDVLILGCLQWVMKFLKKVNLNHL